MSVRKRTWKTAKGETKEAWVVDYADQTGKRRLRTFGRKKRPTPLRQRLASKLEKGSTRLLVPALRLLRRLIYGSKAAKQII